jgi:hypothetical protein
MLARPSYGMARRRQLPAMLGRLHPWSRNIARTAFECPQLGAIFADGQSAFDEVD